MGGLVKQSVTEVVFMDHLSDADNVRHVTLRIDCEGSGRFLVLRNEREGSEIYFNTLDDLKLVFDTAKALWEQGDLYAPGDSALDYAHAKKPEVSWLPPAKVPA